MTALVDDSLKLTVNNMSRRLGGGESLAPLLRQEVAVMESTSIETLMPTGEVSVLFKNTASHMKHKLLLTINLRTSYHLIITPKRTSKYLWAFLGFI